MKKLRTSQILLTGSLLWIILSVFCVTVWAKDLGTFGSVYPVAEPDFIQQLQATLQQKIEHGDLARWQSQQQAALQAALDRPPPVAGLSPALRTRHGFFDPSLIVPTDVRDANGHLLLAAGSRWNPLKQVHWSTTLIFFDGDNPQQVAWAAALDQQFKGRDRLILVKGSLRETTQYFRSTKHHPAPPLYFDQGGRLTQRLQITHTPATVTQTGDRLEITEVAI
jgi:conjugal transfer pilus assembly protein TraW